MARAYSVCFFQVAGASAQFTYIVPGGKKALVRAVTCMSGGAGTGRCYLGVGTAYVWASPNLAQYVGHNAELRLVLAAEQVLRLLTEGTDTRVHVAGYLLDDDPGAPAPFADAQTVEMRVPIGPPYGT